MVKKSFDAIYESARKMAISKHSIALNRGSSSVKTLAGLTRPTSTNSGKSSSKVRG